MKHRMIATLSVSALMMGGTMVGCTAGGGQGIASASDRNVKVADKQAASDAAKASKALAKGNAPTAIRLAESAVQLSPRNAGYRMLLGQAYLSAGRFVSARQAYSDVLQLSPNDQAIVGKAALNLALAETASGDWATARNTLDLYAHDIPASDLGLALALAGNPSGAVAILTQAARTTRADAKLRQNLALSFALAGNWEAARLTAAVDMSPADVDARLASWAQFAQPDHAADQVATLLGVTPVADQGQPVALALNASVPIGVPVAPVVPVAIAAKTIHGDDAPPVKVAAAPSGIVFGPAQEVVQQIPVRLIRPAAGAMKIMVAKVRAPVAAPTPVAGSDPSIVKPISAQGDWYVQFGAYENAAVARDGWSRIQHRYAALRELSPTGANFASKSGSFYRLSVGGFARGDADRLCRSVRAKGGACFVRKDAGDAVAKWLVPAKTQMASR